jgi:hypothetical protein
MSRHCASPSAHRQRWGSRKLHHQQKAPALLLAESTGAELLLQCWRCVQLAAARLNTMMLKRRFSDEAIRGVQFA